MFFTLLLDDNERALLHRNGHLTSYLRAGRHRRFIPFVRFQAEALNPRTGWLEMTPTRKKVLPPDEVAPFEVPPDHIGLVTFDGRPHTALSPGSYGLWQVLGSIKGHLVDLTPLKPVVPEAFLGVVSDKLIQPVLVFPYERVLLYENGLFRESLGEGRHVISLWNRKVELIRVDLREQELQVTGQELMSQDKVTLRLNLLMKFQVSDPLASVQTVSSLRDSLYAEMQMAARQAVASVPIDQLLERRVELAAQMTEAVKARASEWGVTVLRMDIKDVVLPGEMKNLLNQVIEAEKKAAAQVILRREEVAATRSLANTARMMENNPALVRLKELEAWKEIATTVGNLTIVAGGNLGTPISLPLPTPPDGKSGAEN